MDSFILDVDGTLWDSTPIVARAWTKALEEGGCEREVTQEELKGLFGKTMKVIGEELLPEESQERRQELMDLCCRYEHEYLTADPCRICYPGVLDVIPKLAESHRVLIVSNCQSGYIELFLEKTGLGPWITDFECYGNTKKNKGENIRAIVERNRLESPVYVGDTQGDRQAAGEAGVPFVWASYGFGTPENWDKKIKEFSELLKWD
ncbi:MAG TPA: HAD family hydrolase [Candidatus Choladousia intestinigallinarum]|nr:HAD family hydrolase [Candidatus Choladousia intestinigallinarum]